VTDKRTGFINYRNLPPDPRLAALAETWTRLARSASAGGLPVWNEAARRAFAAEADHMSLVEVRHEGTRRRYFVVQEGPAVVAAVGLDGSGTYVDDIGDTPEFTSILTSDYDGILASRQPRLYAEEHHLDGRERSIMGIQMPFAAEGAAATGDARVIVEFVYPLIT